MPVTQLDEEVGGREREWGRGWRGRCPDGAHLDLGAIGRPGRDLPLDGKSRAPYEEHGGVADGLEAGLEVPRQFQRR